MQVEHLTVGGSSVIRNTNDIYPEIIEAFKAFRIKGGIKQIKIPGTTLKIKVSATNEGAVFDISKNGIPAI